VRESEILRTRPDKRAPGAGMPREGRRRISGKPPGRAVLWHSTPAESFEPEPVWGMYPRGFVAWAIRAIQCQPGEVLHVCSGGLSRDVGGLRVDLRAAARPDVMADGRSLPFRDGIFGGVLIDPPYSVEYAQDLYGTEYPRPSHLLREASRVVRPGGRVGILHFLVPAVPKALMRLERVHGVTQGCGYRIRAFTVFRRDDSNLGMEAPDATA